MSMMMKMSGKNSAGSESERSVRHMSINSQLQNNRYCCITLQAVMMMIKMVLMILIITSIFSADDDLDQLPISEQSLPLHQLQSNDDEDDDNGDDGDGGNDYIDNE